MKLQLTIEGGSLAGQTFDLQTGFLTVGRGETCSVRFDPFSERVASKQHAFIEAKADGYYVTDNQSTNGTLLNGSVVNSAKLSSGDRIQFGRNGVTALVTIDGDAASVAIPQASFRDVQVQQFNQIAASGPVNVQNSLSNLGLGNVKMQAPGHPAESSTKKYVWAAVAILGVVFCSLIVIILLTSTLSQAPNGGLRITQEGVLLAVIASVVAFTPAVIYILPLIWLDRYDPEPLWLLALAFAWGALVAVIVSFIINTTISQVVGSVVSPNAGRIVGAVISAPVFEEGSKGLGVVLIMLFFRKYFDDILDGIVFAGVIALGFATVENVLYYGNSLKEAGFAGMAVLFVVRGVFSPFAHVTFTSMTGIGCGIARESHKTYVRILLPLLGYLGAMTLHGIWNSLAVLGGLQGFVLGYLVIELPFFLIFVGFSWYVMHRQGRILREMLAIDIARGLISRDVEHVVTSPIQSSLWLVKGLFAGKYRARSRYLKAVGKLGLSYWHIQRATAAQGNTGSFQQNPILREEVLRWTDQI